MPRISGRGSSVLRSLVRQNIMVINSPLIRRTALDRVGTFDESLPRADDWDLWVRFALAGLQFSYLDEPHTLALVRAHATSLTRRDRRLVQSMITIHRKVAALARDPELRKASEVTAAWLERVRELGGLIDRTIPPGSPFILIDGDQIRSELTGYPAIPFTERHGEYFGPPATGAMALAEFDRLRRTGVHHLVIAWTAQWYLSHFSSLREELDRTSTCVGANLHGIVYQLHQDASAPTPPTCSGQLDR
jgi:hypothetical protein